MLVFIIIIIFSNAFFNVIYFGILRESAFSVLKSERFFVKGVLPINLSCYFVKSKVIVEKTNEFSNRQIAFKAT